MRCARTRRTRAAHAAHTRCACGADALRMRRRCAAHAAHTRCACGAHALRIRCTCLQQQEEEDERQPCTQRIKDVVHHEHLMRGGVRKVCSHSAGCARVKAGANERACQA